MYFWRARDNNLHKLMLEINFPESARDTGAVDAFITV